MRKYLILAIILFLSACQVEAEEVEPTSTPNTTLDAQTPNKVEPTQTFTPEPTKTLSELGFQVKVGEILCNLQPTEYENQIVYLAQCEEGLLFPISSEVTIELVPPDEEHYQLIEIENFEEVAGTIFPDSLFGIFSAFNDQNKAGCIIPFRDKAGEVIVCGFLMLESPDKGFDIFIEGKTIRIVYESFNSNGKQSNSNGGEEKPPPSWNE